MVPAMLVFGSPVSADVTGVEAIVFPARQSGTDGHGDGDSGGTLFEVAVRAPLIIADPRRQATAGCTCRRIVQFVDIYPTLADLAGLPQPPALEGVSLRPLLDKPDAAWDRPAFTVQSRGWSLGRRIRTERWAYSEWDGSSEGAMLFDHDADPHEIRNLAADPAHANALATLQEQLRTSPVGRSAGDAD